MGTDSLGRCLPLSCILNGTALIQHQGKVSRVDPIPALSGATHSVGGKDAWIVAKLFRSDVK